MRHVGPMRNPGMGHIYLNLNRNKRSIALDLEAAEARDALRKLAATADVFVSNVRPAAMARLGLAMTTSAPSIRASSMQAPPAMAPAGAMPGKPAYDDLIQGLTGIARDPARRLGRRTALHADRHRRLRTRRTLSRQRDFRRAASSRADRRRPGDRNSDVPEVFAGISARRSSLPA